MPERIGFIGLGGMGLPMAKRVRSCGYELTVCGHTRREPVEEMKILGASEAENPKEVARVSDVVITMVRNDDDTREVVLGSNGVIEGARGDSAIIMMSTLSPAFCREVGKSARDKNIGVLDAPVTGADMKSAERGKLSIMIGGEKQVFEICRPLLETMGSHLLHCGELGMGQTVKLADNMTFLVTMQATYETVSWGIKNGADEKALIELMKLGTGNSWTVQNWDFIKKVNVEPPPPITQLGVKDLQYGLRIAENIGQPMPLASLVEQTLVKGPLKLAEQ